MEKQGRDKITFDFICKTLKIRGDPLVRIVEIHGGADGGATSENE